MFLGWSNGQIVPSPLRDDDFNPLEAVRMTKTEPPDMDLVEVLEPLGSVAEPRSDIQDRGHELHAVLHHDVDGISRETKLGSLAPYDDEARTFQLFVEEVRDFVWMNSDGDVHILEATRILILAHCSRIPKGQKSMFRRTWSARRLGKLSSSISRKNQAAATSTS